jgi:hypothetical protein
MREFVKNLEQNLKANKELVHTLILERARTTQIVPTHYLQQILDENKTLESKIR